MADRYDGDIKTLTAIDPLGLSGSWTEIECGHQFRARSGAGSPKLREDGFAVGGLNLRAELDRWRASGRRCS